MALFMIHCESSLPFCIEPTAIESINVERVLVMGGNSPGLHGTVAIRMRGGHAVECLMSTLERAEQLRDRLHRLSSDPQAEARSGPPPTLRAMREARLSPR